MEELKFTNEVLNKNSTVHVLPCKIMYDGKAEVDSYFNSSILRSGSHIKAELNETEGIYMIDILLEYLYSLKLIKLFNKYSARGRTARKTFKWSKIKTIRKLYRYL